MVDETLGRSQFRESVSSKIKTFNAERPKIEEAPPLPYTKTQLLESTNTVTHDTLVMCLDKPLDLEKTGTVVAGYDKTTGELLSFKRINPDVQAEYKRVNKYPPEVTDIEDLIKKGTNNPRLGVYKRKFTHDGKEFKVYSLASTDLETHINKKKEIPPKTALNIVIQIADATRTLHRLDIAHLDIAPPNILIDPNGRVRLIDFDSASLRNGPNKTFTRGFLRGNRFIRPPELFTENPTITESADTYQLCILLYNTITGKHTFEDQGKTIEERNEHARQMHLSGEYIIPDNIPDSIKKILKKGIQPKREDRYQDTFELLNDLIDAYNEIDTAETTPEQKDKGNSIFSRKIGSQTLFELETSINSREKIQQESENDQTKLELELLRARYVELETLRTMENRILIQVEIDRRKEKLGKILDTDKLLSASIQTEIALLEEALRISEVPPGSTIIKQQELSYESIPSPTLLQNSDIKLNPVIEREDYLARQKKEYINQLENLGSQIKEPMDKNCKAVICIPVAGHQENANIYRSLEAFAQQTADPSDFEIILFLNSSTKALQQQEAISKTHAEIRRAQEKYPTLRLRVISAVIPDSQVRIGNLRKIVTDVALLRSQKSQISHDVLLLSNDADNQGISSNYVDSFIQHLDNHPDQDGAVGNLQYDPQAFVRFPTIYAVQGFTTLLDQRGFSNGNVTLLGANSAMKTSIYCAIGGYPTALKTAEQKWTGDTIRKLRKTKKTLGFVDKAILTTSSRRRATAYLLGQKGKVMFGDETQEQAMRSLDIFSYPPFDMTDPVQVAKLSLQLEQSINETITSYDKGERLGKNANYYKSNLRKLGIEYQVEGEPLDPNSRIVITDITRFKEKIIVMQRLITNGLSNMAEVMQTIEQL